MLKNVDNYLGANSYDFGDELLLTISTGESQNTSS